MAARAAYMPPLRTDPQYCYCRKTAGGACPAPTVRYIFTELGSVAENAAALGAPVPEVLLNALAVGKQKAEK